MRALDIRGLKLAQTAPVNSALSSCNVFRYFGKSVRTAHATVTSAKWKIIVGHNAHARVLIVQLLQCIHITYKTDSYKHLATCFLTSDSNVCR